MEHNLSEEVIHSNSMGPNPIKLLRWNLQNLTIPKGSKILDLGSGKGLTSVYLANELDCDVIAFDKEITPDESLDIMRGLQPARIPLPMSGDARHLPFARGYFDYIIATDSLIYFGTDDLYFPYISQFLKENGYLCFTVPGFNKDVKGAAELPEHLRPFWADECWTWHTRDWWKSHLERTGCFRVIECEAMENSYKFWRDETLKGPEGWRKNDLPVVERDQGEYMGFIKATAQKICREHPL